MMKSATRMKSKTAFSVGERVNEIPKDRDEVHCVDEVENLCFRLGLNPLIAAAISSELCEDFICIADLFHRQVDLIALASKCLTPILLFP